MTRTENDRLFYENRKQKRMIHPPCTTTVIDPVTKKQALDYPCVLCSLGCDTCGWNPEVKKKRVDRMLAEIEERRAKARKAKRKKGGT